MLRSRRELQRDARAPGAVHRVHRVDAGDLAELALERRRHRRGHDLRIRARQLRRHRDRREIDVRQVVDRQRAESDGAEEHDRSDQHRGRDRPFDEYARQVHGFAPTSLPASLFSFALRRAAFGVPSAVTVALAFRLLTLALAFFALPLPPLPSPASCTVAPGVSACGISVITRSPALTPVRDHDLAADLPRDLHRLHLDLAVLVDQINEAAVLPRLHRGLRHDDRFRFDRQHDAHVHELTGPDHFLRVRHARLEQHRAGLRRDRIVDEHELAFGDRRRIAIRQDLDAHLPCRSGNCRISSSWRSGMLNDTRIGSIVLIVTSGVPAARRRHEIARLDRERARAARDRRRDARELELDARLLRSGLVRRHGRLERFRRGDGDVVLLARDELALEQRLRAAPAARARSRAAPCRARAAASAWLYCAWNVARIDLEQHLPRLDLVAFLELRPIAGRRSPARGPARCARARRCRPPRSAPAWASPPPARPRTVSGPPCAFAFALAFLRLSLRPPSRRSTPAASNTNSRRRRPAPITTKHQEHRQSFHFFTLAAAMMSSKPVENCRRASAVYQSR